MGKQLDSLADVVTFGVLPGLIWKSLMEYNGYCPTGVFCINQYIWMMIPLAAAYRLAKFNIDTRQTTGFIGIPTPMTGMALASFAWMSYTLGHSGSIWIIEKPLIDLSGLFSNYYVWLYMPLVASYMMISEIPMLSLKRVKNDPLGKYKMILLVMTVPCLLFGSTGVIVYYFGYILVSILSNFAVKSINQ
jgi:CDP-diacylglycerol--serine O-phosphatidyltransferase